MTCIHDYGTKIDRSKIGRSLYFGFFGKSEILNLVLLGKVAVRKFCDLLNRETKIFV